MGSELGVGVAVFLFVDHSFAPFYMEQHLKAIRMVRQDGSEYDVPISKCTWCQSNAYRAFPVKSEGSDELCRFYPCGEIPDKIQALMFDRADCGYRLVHADLCFMDFSKPDVTGYHTERRSLKIAQCCTDRPSPAVLEPRRVEIDRSCASKCDVYNLFGISVENLKERPELREDAYRNSVWTTIPPFGRVSVEWADGFGTLNAISEYLIKYKPRALVSLTKEGMVAMTTFMCYDITGWIKTDKVWHDLHTIRVSFAMTSDGHRIIDWVSPI